MRIAISQPTYLPWLGYFDLMDQVDVFVLLDTVQFEKQSWQQRNRIKTPAGLQWLTVPVVFRGRFGQKVQEVEIRETNFGRTHLRAIELNYARARWFADFFPGLSGILGDIKPGTKLADLNARLLEWLVGSLGIRTRMIRASALNEGGTRTRLLANICSRLGATQYLSAIGSAAYLLDEVAVMAEANVEVAFHNYIHPQYRQRFPPFLPFASVVDLVFNEGDKSIEIIRSGRLDPLTAQQASAQMAGEREA